MKSIFDPTTSEELIYRIQSLSENNAAQWGKMNVYQMIKHCSLCEDMMQGKIIIRRVFIGRLIGKMILKKILKDDSLFGKSSPTSPLLMTTTLSGDIEQQKKE